MQSFVKRTVGLVAGLTFFGIGQVANATLISGDFRTESNLPDYRTGSPLVYQSTAQTIGAGYELDSTDFLQNPDNWGGGVVWMDYNPFTNILTLDSQDTWDFQTFDAWITNISFDLVGEHISGFSLIDNGLTTPQFAPTLTFTDNSLHISYDYTPGVYNFTGGTASFRVETQASAVPEPASIALLSLGLAGLGFSRRKSK